MQQCQPGFCGTVSKKDGNFRVALGWSGDVQVVADQVAAARKAQVVLLGGADPEDVQVVGDQVAAAQGAMVAARGRLSG